MFDAGLTRKALGPTWPSGGCARKELRTESVRGHWFVHHLVMIPHDSMIHTAKEEAEREDGTWEKFWELIFLQEVLTTPALLILDSESQAFVRSKATQASDKTSGRTTVASVVTNEDTYVDTLLTLLAQAYGLPGVKPAAKRPIRPPKPGS